MKVVVLTGAGISAESGIATFRDKDGIWAKVDVMEMATRHGFDRDPERVLAFYNELRRGARHAKPNAAHRALAEFEAKLAKHGGKLTIITQNVDLLHEAAGSRNVVHVHGRGDELLCNACRDVYPWGDADISINDRCQTCGSVGALRPNVVWFGECSRGMERAADALAEADLFIAIGTSGAIYGNSMTMQAMRHGAHTVELNLKPSGLAFDEVHAGRASEIVPWFLNSLEVSA